jgi:hypothetical protein
MAIVRCAACGLRIPITQTGPYGLKPDIGDGHVFFTTCLQYKGSWIISLPPRDPACSNLMAAIRAADWHSAKA